MRKLSLFFLLLCAGCFQTTNDEDAIRTVPVTNNPHVIPSHGSGLPMSGSY